MKSIYALLIALSMVSGFTATVHTTLNCESDGTVTDARDGPIY